MLAFLMASQVSIADSTLSINTDNGTARLQVKNDWLLLKLDDVEGNTNIQNTNVSEVIFDNQKQTLYVIDHDEQTVSPITKETIEQLSSTVDMAVGVLDSMPSEQRDSISDFMRGFGIAVPEAKSPTPIELESVSTQKFRGIQCQEMQVIEEDQELGHVCITQGNSTPLSTDDYQTLLQTQEFLLLLAQKAKPFVAQHGHSIPNLDGIALDGLIVYGQQSQINDEQTASANFVITKIDQGDIDDIVLPTGYRSKSILFAH